MVERCLNTSNFPDAVSGERRYKCSLRTQAAVGFSLGLFRMHLAVALPTEGDEIFFCIVAQLASRRDVMNF